MKDTVGLNRLSFFLAKNKGELANGEPASSAAIAREVAGKQQNLRALCGNLHFLGRR